MTTGSIVAPNETSSASGIGADWLACLGPRSGKLLGNGSVATVVHTEGDRGELRLVSDLDGSAPEYASRGKCGVIFSGDLYDRQELAHSTGIHVTDQMSSAEVALEAYLVRGEPVLSQIKGVFALIVWDSRRDLFLCARDRMGVYPLFYSDNGSDVVASTSVRALLRYPGVSHEINRAALADRFCGRLYNVHEN
jgi:asparagine synthetase B (glutamine-hydrolysing)